MTSLQSELRQKYPTANHAADLNCRRCLGRGERHVGNGALVPCICIFVDHQYCVEVADSLARVATTIVRELREQGVEHALVKKAAEFATAYNRIVLKRKS